MRTRLSPARFKLREKAGTCKRCGATGVKIRDHYGPWDCEACIRRFDMAQARWIKREVNLALKAAGL